MGVSSIQDRVADLQELLAMPGASRQAFDVRDILLRHPSLLAASPSAVSSSLDALGAIYYDGLGKAVQRVPTLLSLSAAVIREHHAGLARELAVSSAALEDLVTWEPRLLKSTPVGAAACCCTAATWA